MAGAAGTVTFVSGTVMLKRPGSEHAIRVSEGDVVSVADDIICGEDAFAQLTLTDGAFVNIFPRSTVRVNQFAFDAAANRRTTRLKVETGKARFVLFKVLDKDSSFFVETNTALLVLDTIADAAVSVTGPQTLVAALAATATVRSASRLTVGEVKLGVNQKTLVKEKAPPEPESTVTREERKEFMKDIRSCR